VAGDCFIIKREQPYTRSATQYGDPATFYSPFGPIATPTLDAAATPAASVTKVSNFELKVTVSAGAAGT
jgi:hypothetical protein